MVPTRSGASADAGGQIDGPVRFPCPHRGCGGIAILMVLFPISRPNWRSAQVAVTRLLFFLVDVSQMGWLGRSGSPLAPRLSWVSAFFTGTTWAELEPARIGIDCCRSGIMRTVATGTRVSIWRSPQCPRC